MKLRQRIENVGLNYKKEIFIYILVVVFLLVGGGAAFFFLRNLFTIIVPLALALVFTFVYFSRYSSLEEKQTMENINDFICLFTYFKTYVKNDYNIYSALKEISAFANPFSLEKLTVLINEIDEDKSVEPFIRFARNYKLLLIEQLMISVYQMIDQGNDSSYMTQFDILFNKLSEEQYQKENERKEKKLSTLTTFPLIGSGLLIVLISIGVMQIIGDMINGL